MTDMKPMGLWVEGDWIAAIAVVVLAHRLEALRHFLRVAMLAPRADLRAAGYWVPSRISPFDA